MKIIAYGPIIIQEGKLLVTQDKKDPFYKIPGGKPEPGETGQQTCIREVREETGLEIIILGEATVLKLEKDPKTGALVNIELYHYFAKLKTMPMNFKKYIHNGHEVVWLPIDEIKQGRHKVAPNIKFLIEKGDIR